MIIRIKDYRPSKENLLKKIIRVCLNLKISFAKVILCLFVVICVLFWLIAFKAPLIAAGYNRYSSEFYQASANISATLYNSMSPFIAIVAAILTFIAFWVQHEANKKMLENHERQEVERQFYEMLHIHKENVKELKWNRWSIVGSSNPKYVCEDETIGKGKFFYNNKYAFKPVMGREVFEYYLVEFFIIEQCLNRAIETINNSCKKNDNKSSCLSYSNQSVKDYRALLNLAYKIFYEGDSILKYFFKKRAYFFFDACERKFNLMKKIYDKNGCFNFNLKKFCLKKKPFLFNDYNGMILLYCYYYLCEYKKDYGSYSFKTSFARDFSGSDLFQGHIYELNHYYRHLYQMVKIVANYDEQVIKYEEKRKYLKMLRAQLTSVEQLMLFYNWLSGYGGDWENEKNHFFTTYRMIHNMDIKHCLFLNSVGYPKIVKMVKKINPEYRAYKDDYLFEFEDVKIKNLTKIYDRKKMGDGPFKYNDLLPQAIARIIGRERYFQAQLFVMKTYKKKVSDNAIAKKDYEKAITDIQNYIKQMFIWED